jgi:ABC-2 type transport system permease protein
MIEAMRSLVITGWDAQALALGFSFTVLMIIFGLAGSARLLKTRMART